MQFLLKLFPFSFSWPYKLWLSIYMHLASRLGIFSSMLLNVLALRTPSLLRSLSALQTMKMTSSSYFTTPVKLNGAEELMKHVDCFIFDCDGVIW
jgi:hypothetical protein